MVGACQQAPAVRRSADVDMLFWQQNNGAADKAPKAAKRPVKRPAPAKAGSSPSIGLANFLSAPAAERSAGGKKPEQYDTRASGRAIAGKVRTPARGAPRVPSATPTAAGARPAPLRPPPSARRATPSPRPSTPPTRRRGERSAAGAAELARRAPRPPARPECDPGLAI